MRLQPARLPEIGVDRSHRDHRLPTCWSGTGPAPAAPLRARGHLRHLIVSY